MQMDQGPTEVKRAQGSNRGSRAFRFSRGAGVGANLHLEPFRKYRFGEALK